VFIRSSNQRHFVYAALINRTAAKCRLTVGSFVALCVSYIGKTMDKIRWQA